MRPRGVLICFRKSCDFLPVGRLGRKCPTSIPPAQPGQLRYEDADAKADKKRETEPSSPAKEIDTPEKNVETESEVSPLIKGNKVSQLVPPVETGLEKIPCTRAVAWTEHRPIA